MDIEEFGNRPQRAQFSFLVSLLAKFKLASEVTGTDSEAPESIVSTKEHFHCD
jgi:hypothetical protein